MQNTGNEVGSKDVRGVGIGDVECGGVMGWERAEEGRGRKL